jgi:hypothetical protein
MNPRRTLLVKEPRVADADRLLTSSAQRIPTFVSNQFRASAAGRIASAAALTQNEQPDLLPGFFRDKSNESYFLPLGPIRLVNDILIP